MPNPLTLILGILHSLTYDFLMRIPPTSRRTFLSRGSLATTSLVSSWMLSLPQSIVAATSDSPLRFGLIADIHKDIIHDADDRLQTFITAMSKERLDFILQLGDFCIPKPENQKFLEIWKSYQGPRYHVIGNHDTDGGYTRQQTVDYYGMPHRYYAFDQGGFRFIILDGNDRPADHQSGYPRYIAEDQHEWLRAQIEASKTPIVIFSHQSLENQSGVQNGANIRATLEQANDKAGFRKVIACFSGHHHRDYVRQINDIVYPQINSASYFWVGNRFQHLRYSEKIDQRFPNIKNTVPYREPLFAVVEIDAHRGHLGIQGRQSSFVGPAPWELGESKEYWKAQSLGPQISAWKMPI